MTDLNGGRISLGRATIRLVVKSFLSSWFLIGYVIAFFTQKKQALHDLIADTLVLTKPTYPVAAQSGYHPQYPHPQATFPQQPPTYPSPQTYSCPGCGATLQPSDRFCSNCGRNL